mmetsp:Transcript_22944/g.47873  ORF Transcript_22944/g.47873 Transcript_22944/m.47873 type:complete len:175 (-) Transcript_22944:736-1260(-)
MNLSSATVVFYFLSLLGFGQAFAPAGNALLFGNPTTVHHHAATLTTLHLMDPHMVMDATIPATAAVQSSSFQLAETQPWVEPLAGFLDPFLNFLSFAMLARVVLSWYPEQKINEMPWLLVAVPTQPLLRVVKGVIPPAFGVDITPVFWLGIFTFVHEILLGQQGLLTMKIKYGI